MWRGGVGAGTGRRLRAFVEYWLGSLFCAEDLEGIDKKKAVPIKASSPPGLVESKTFIITLVQANEH